MPKTESDVDRIAHVLWEADRYATPVPPVRNELPGLDIPAAYDIQRKIIEARVSAGARRIGRKVGLTSRAVQAQLRVTQPDFGVLMDDMQVEMHGSVAMTELISPKVEAEVAFVLGRDLDEAGLEREAVVAAVAYVSPALEIVDSRIRDWDISIVDTIADNGSSARFVLGPERRSLHDVVPRDVRMRLTSNQREVSAGKGSACLGDPVNALLWLARTAQALQDPLRAGEIVLSGALGPLHPVGAGELVHAEISGLGRVAVTFVKGVQ